MLVIIAGYENDIEDLLSSNQGMKRRFSERLEFKNWDSEGCLTLICKKCELNQFELPSTLFEQIKANFDDLSKRDSWGNAGDVNTIFDKMCEVNDVNRSDGDDDDDNKVFNAADVEAAFVSLRRQRHLVSQNTTLNANEVKHSPIMIQQTQVDEVSLYNIAPVSIENLGEAIIEEKKLCEEKEVVEEEELPEDGIIWSSLEEALTELGYDLYQTRDALVSGGVPQDVVNHVAGKLSCNPTKLRIILDRQVPTLLIQTNRQIQLFERELLLQRQAREAIERADAAEKLRLIEEERVRQEEAIMIRIAMIGKCCMGFDWIKQGGGYRCAGGSHFVSDAQVSKGGFNI